MARWWQIDDQPADQAFPHRGQLGGDDLEVPVHHQLGLRAEVGEAARNMSTLFNEALNETVIVAENGGRRKISKRQAIVKQIVNKAAKGDWRCTKLLLDLPQESGSPTEPESSFDAADAKVIEQLKTRLRGSRSGSND